MSHKLDHLPRAFIWRRLHSLTGLWLVLFLIEHLLTNSQAALLLGDSGKGFVRMVDWLHNLPYLHVLELALLGIPIALHGFWGVRYLFTSKFNSQKSDGSKPSLQYGRNRAYTWQRITSWILVVLLTMHVVKFRFLDYPGSVNVGSNPTYFVTVSMDPGLYTVADRLHVELYDEADLRRMKKESKRQESALEQEAKRVRKRDSDIYNRTDDINLSEWQVFEEELARDKALSSVKLKEGEILAAADQFGTATLLAVRDTFKSPIWVGIYTIFVLSAVYHAFNGLWTSMLTWGWVIKRSAQKGALKFTITLMLILAFLGMAAIWGTYFLNLKN